MPHTPHFFSSHPIWYKVPHPSSYSQSGQVLILSSTKYHTHPPIPSQDRCSSYLVQSTTSILLFPVRTGAHPIWYKVPHPSYFQSGQVLILSGTKYSRAVKRNNCALFDKSMKLPMIVNWCVNWCVKRCVTILDMEASM